MSHTTHHSIATTQHPESELTTSLNKNIINCHHIHFATNLINYHFCNTVNEDDIRIKSSAYLFSSSLRKSPRYDPAPVTRHRLHLAVHQLARPFDISRR